MTVLGRMSSLSLATSSGLMAWSAALLKSRLPATARPSLVLYPPRSLKFGTDSKLMCVSMFTAACSRSPPDGQALQVEIGHAPGHEVGHDARGAARHRPAHVTVPAVEEEVAMAGEAEDGRPVRRHRSETRAGLAALVVGGAGDEVT